MCNRSQDLCLERTQRRCRSPATDHAAHAGGKFGRVETVIVRVAGDTLVQPARIAMVQLWGASYLALLTSVKIGSVRRLWT